MKSTRRTAVVSIAGIVLCGGFAAACCQADEKVPAKIEFKRTRLDTVFRSEGAAVGDFNHDGKMDISAGSVYYAAPDWKLHAIAEKPEEYDPHNYSHSFCNFAEDVNGDGWTDLLVVDFPGDKTWWFENPQTAGSAWKKHVVTPITNNESPVYLDVDGDGKRELILGFATDGNFDSPERRLGFARPAADPFQPWTLTTISAKAAPGTQRFSHGLGVGDVNADGRADVLVPQGWWQAPSSGGTAAEWTFHPAPLGADCANMFVYDVDGDGDNDVLSSAAHQLGIWWHEQTADGWTTHEIDHSFSQTHAMCFADINGDGLPDFVTGKRWWAHGPNGDVNPNDPAVMCWFELTRNEGKPVWIPHVFDHDSGMGTQFEVADVNGDGLLDVVTANKKGANYFEQVRK